MPCSPPRSPVPADGKGDRLVDVVLSHGAHPDLDDGWVSGQHDPVSPAHDLATGRPWDLDRAPRGMPVLHPRTTGPDRDDSGTGTADGLGRDADLVREHDSEVLVVVSAGTVHRLDHPRPVRPLSPAASPPTV